MIMKLFLKLVKSILPPAFDQLPPSNISLLTFNTLLWRNFKFLTKYGMIQTELTFRFEFPAFFRLCSWDSLPLSISMGWGSLSEFSFRRKISTIAWAASSSQASPSSSPEKFHEKKNYSKFRQIDFNFHKIQKIQKM